MRLATLYKLLAIMLAPLLLASVLPGKVQGQTTRTFSGTGNFSDVTKWDGGTTLPAAGSNLIINGACTVDNNALTDNIAYGTLTIGSSTSRTLNWISGGTNHLNVTNVLAGSVTSVLDMTNGGTLIINGTWTSTRLTFTYGTGTIELRSAITLPAAYATYHNLTINGSGNTVKLGVATAITGDLTITSGIYNANNFSSTVSGNWVNNASTTAFTYGTGTVTFNGTSAVSIGGTFSTTFNKLTINCTNGLTLGTTTTVGGSLTFTSGNITTGTNSLYLNSTGTVSHTSGYVIGNFQKNIGTGATSKIFEIGDAVNYSPVTVAFASVSTAGDLTASTASGDHANIGNSTINVAKSVNQTWTLTNSSTSPIAFTSYSPTFTFVSTDKDAGANYLNFKVGRYNAGWTYPTVGTKGSTTTQATGVTAFGDFQLGEVCITPAAPTVTSPVNYCLNVTAVPLTANGTSLLWGSTVGGTNTLSGNNYVAPDVNNNKMTLFTTFANNVTITSIDYYTIANQTTSLLQLGIFDNSGTLISASSTITSVPNVGSSTKVTNIFNFTIPTAGNYKIGIVSGSGNLAGDSPTFPLTENSGTINLTGITTGVRCFNHIQFTTNGSSTAPTPVTSIANTTNYNVSQTVSGCLSPQATIAVIVNAPPTTSVAGADQTGVATCGLTTVTLAANTPAVGTGAWSIVSGSGGSITTPTSATSTFSGNAGTTYTLRWTISNSPCTASTDDVLITFNQNPTTSVAGADQAGATTCGLTTVTLAANTPAVGTGAWSIITGIGGTITTPTSATSTFSGVAGSSYTLRWTISNSPCSASTDDVVITFNQNPTVTAVTTQSCVGGSTGSITASANGGTSPYTYNWNAGSYQSTPLFSGLAAGTYPLNAQSSAGCIGTTSVTVSEYATSPDDTAATATDSWIGHMYGGKTFSNYVGHFTELETFDESFGGSTVCFPIISNLLPASIYTESFSVKFRMTSTKKGLYIVDLGSDDGSRLTVDSIMLYNNWHDHSFNANPSVLMNLNGASSLLYEYYEAGGNNEVKFKPLTLVLANTLSTNTTQNICLGNPGSVISGDSYGTLPTGITLSGTGYQWSYSTTITGIRNSITGATAATYTPSTTVAPFNAAGTYYIFRNASLSSTNNVSPTTYVATNESNAATLIVTATPTPTISYAGSPYCSNLTTGTATLTGSANGIYSSTAGLTIAAATGTIKPNTSNAGPYTVTYTIAAAGGCNAVSTTAPLTITTLPAATITYTGSPYSFCSNAGTATVVSTGTTGGSYSSTTGLVINSSTGVITLSTSTPGTYTATYSVAAAGGCALYTTTANVQIAAIANNQIDYTNGTHGILCATAAENATATLTAPAGTVFTTVGFASYGSPVGTCQAFSITSCHATTSQSIAESYLLGNNTSSIPATNGVFTDPCVGTVKSLDVQATYTQPICAGTTPGTITGTTPTGGNGVYTFLWEVSTTSSSSGFATASGTSNARDYVSGILSKNTWYRRTVLSGGCSNVSPTIQITVTQQPVATISYATSPYCSSGGTAAVTFSGTAGGVYSSTTGLVFNSTATGQVNLATSTAGSYTVTYTMAAAGGCFVQTATASVTISAAPSATISYIGNPFYSNTESAVITNTGTTGGIYSSTAGLNMIASTGMVEVDSSTAATYIVTYTIAAGNGCPQFQTTASITIHPYPYTIFATAPNLATASNFVLYTVNGAVGNTGVSQITGTIGTNIGAITGFGSSISACSIHNIDSVTSKCSSDLIAAYHQIDTTSATFLHGAVLGNGEILSAGVYSIAAAGSAAGILTLDAQNDPEAIFIFKIGGAFAAGAATTVNLINGAVACNVFWKAEGAISMGAATTMRGTLIANGAISLGAAGTLEGRMFSIMGAVSVNTVTASIPTCSSSAITTWTGASSTDWNTPCNWLYSAIPTTTTNITIPGGLTNYPILNSGIGSVKNIIIQSGAAATITGARLQISGTISNTGTFTASNGTIEMNGSSLQNIPASTFQGNLVQHLTINNSLGVNLNGTLNIAGILLASTGQFSTNGYLTLIATASQTALIDGSGLGSVTGNVTMQGYLASAFGYHYISSPFQAALVSQLSNDIKLIDTTTIPSLYRYDESLLSSGWVNYTDSTGLLIPGLGYTANFGTSTSSKIFDIKGVVSNGNLSALTLYNHNNPYTKGFNLVGNPYPSPVDWNISSGWSRTNIDNSIYFFDASASDQYLGTYNSYINGVSSNGFANNIIPAMQGFFVHVSNGSTSYPITGSLTITNTARINMLTPSTRALNGIDDRTLVRLSVQSVTDATRLDPVVVYFDDLATPAFDKEYDALKLMNTDAKTANLYAISTDATNLSISAIPNPGDSSKKIPLGLETNSGEWLVFNASTIRNLPAGMHVYLSDMQAGINQDLQLNPLYRIYLPGGKYKNRFFLTFNKGVISTIPETDTIATAELKIYSAGNGSIIVNSSYSKANLVIMNILGQVVLKQDISGIGTHEIKLEVSTGIYLATLVTDKVRLTKKIFIRN